MKSNVNLDKNEEIYFIKKKIIRKTVKSANPPNDVKYFKYDS